MDFEDPDAILEMDNGKFTQPKIIQKAEKSHN